MREGREAPELPQVSFSRLAHRIFAGLGRARDRIFADLGQARDRCTGHCTRYAVLCVLINLLLIALFLLPAPAGARAEEIAAEMSASVSDGHARMLFTFSEEVKAEAQVANSILVVSFSRPVAVAIDKMEQKLPGYVQAARRDPDGTAVRFSLSRKVTVNVMEAGEKLYVDLLPEGWVGLPPGLPQEVVDDLAKRAREAERRAREKPAHAGKSATPVRLRLASAPGFSRFAFEMAEPIFVSLARDGQELRLLFDAPVKVDLGEAKTQLPAGVVALDVEAEIDRSTVKLVLAPEATARDFREDNAFLIDVMPTPLGNAAPSIEELAAKLRARAADKAELPAVVGPSVSEDARPAPVDLTSRPDGVNGTVFAAARRHSGRLSLSFPFGEPTAAAVFRRGETLWLVFDSTRTIDVSELTNDPSQILRGAEFVADELGGVVRLKLTRAQLPSVEREGFTWVVTLGDGVAVPSRPLPMRRASAEQRAAILIPLQAPGQVHRLIDPEIGDSLLAITAMPPARGILRRQDFVEFRALASIHGVALTPLADDLSVTLSSEGVTVGRPEGLMVSDLPDPPPPPKKFAKRQFTPLDAEIWQAEQDSPYFDREAELVAALAHTQPAQRTDARIMLARFYLANDFATEAKGTLEARDDNQILDLPLYHLMHGIAELKLGRPEEALHDLTRPPLAGMSEALLMRTIALAGLSRWGDVRDALRTGANALAHLPADYQRGVLLSGIRAAVELRDFIEASRLIHELEAAEITNEIKPAYAVLAGRVADGVGRFELAKELYETAALAESGPAAAEARLRSVEMRHGHGELSRLKAIDRMEMLAWTWRGDRIELESLRLLARLYVAEARYREAFRLLDAALLSYPEEEITREFQNEMATVFEDVFLTGKAETQPAIDALALYYDFSKLTPIGRRGDELIRRLADRLVTVDLLDQATELLEHQVEYRLSGAAKAQVAARLAVIHLMNRKPTEAVRVLVATRMPELPQELRDQRLLIEARALSDTGRHDSALELIKNLEGPEADRLRADIAWAAKKWRDAGERIEKLLGERWKNDAPLSETERHDVLRAALAFAMDSESIGLSRLREKYAGKMGEGQDGKVLTMVAAPQGVNAKTLAQAAKALSAFDSLGNFLSLYRARYPEKPLPPDPLPTATAKKVTTR